MIDGFSICALCSKQHYPTYAAVLNKNKVFSICSKKCFDAYNRAMEEDSKALEEFAYTKKLRRYTYPSTFKEIHSDN